LKIRKKEETSTILIEFESRHDITEILLKVALNITTPPEFENRM
jgi:hypothetical protein